MTAVYVVRAQIVRPSNIESARLSLIRESPCGLTASCIQALPSSSQ